MRLWTSRGATLSLSLALVSCSGKTQPEPVGSTSAATSASSSPIASATTSAPTSAPLPPIGDGAAKIVAEDKACAPAEAEIASYLQRGEVAMVARGDEIAVSWLVQVRNDAQIGFGGYDSKAKSVADRRGVATVQGSAPKLMKSKEGWIVSWFDSEGLAFVRPKWEAEPKLKPEHIGTFRSVKPEEASLAVADDGSVVVASTFGTSGDQLTLFRFVMGAGSPTAIGLTKQAVKPRMPVVATDASGYMLVWTEEDGHAQSIRFDDAGQPSAGSKLLLAPGERTDWTMVTTATGFQLAWTEGGKVVTQHLHTDGTANGPPVLVGPGHWPRLSVLGDACHIAFVGPDGDMKDQILVGKLTPGESPTMLVRVSSGKGPVKDPPSFDRAGDRLALFWTEPVSTTVSSKRALLHTIDAACVK